MVNNFFFMSTERLQMCSKKKANKNIIFSGGAGAGADREVRLVHNCDRGLKNASRGLRAWEEYSGPRSQLFTIKTSSRP